MGNFSVKRYRGYWGIWAQSTWTTIREYCRVCPESVDSVESMSSWALSRTTLGAPVSTFDLWYIWATLRKSCKDTWKWPPFSWRQKQRGDENRAGMEISWLGPWTNQWKSQSLDRVLHKVLKIVIWLVTVLLLRSIQIWCSDSCWCFKVIV